MQGNKLALGVILVILGGMLFIMAIITFDLAGYCFIGVFVSFIGIAVIIHATLSDVKTPQRQVSPPPPPPQSTHP